MKKFTIIISSILLVAFSAGSVFAWGSCRGKGVKSAGYNQDCPRYKGEGSGNSAVTELSQEQTDQITALRQQFIDETYEARAAKFAKQQEIRMLMETSNPDREKLGTLSREIADLQKQVMDKLLDFRLGVKKIAPELVTGSGFGQNCSRWSGKGGQKGCRNQGQIACQGGAKDCPGKGKAGCKRGNSNYNNL